jgi:hypothetical protein
MRYQTDSWLFADWAIFGTHIPHWATVIAGLVLVAVLVAWFERSNRTPARFSSRAAYESSALAEHSVSRPTEPTGKSRFA